MSQLKHPRVFFLFKICLLYLEGRERWEGRGSLRASQEGQSCTGTDLCFFLIFHLHFTARAYG